ISRPCRVPSTATSLGSRVDSRRTLPRCFPLRWHVSAQGNCEMKCRSPLCAVFSPDLPPIRVDDGARDRQSEASSMLLGRVERVENLVDHPLGDAGTRIAYHYLDFGIRAHCCPDGDPARI